MHRNKNDTLPVIQIEGIMLYNEKRSSQHP